MGPEYEVTLTIQWLNGVKKEYRVWSNILFGSGIMRVKMVKNGKYRFFPTTQVQYMETDPELYNGWPGNPIDPPQQPEEGSAE